MALTRRSTAVWKGTGKEGSGLVSSTSGVLKDVPYSHMTRFVSEDGRAGTNPEELVAAAHASCFAMKLSFVLGGAGFTPDEILCVANVVLDKVGDGQGVVGVHLDVRAKVPGIGPEEFQRSAEDARKNCPISQLLKTVPITMTALLA